MARIYSTALLAGQSVGIDTQSFTVPTGDVMVVRDLSGSWFNSGPDTGIWQVTVDALALYALVMPPGGGDVFHWEGRIAVPAASTLIALLSSTAVTIDWWISGYLLTP